ncbi:MAG: hypothetical protein JO287_16925 [Pseudonocardiales bacterium]|nr:hypothetical protein [Pseudonocardiales bacterium]
MGDYGVVPPGGITEYLDGLLHPPTTTGPVPVRDLSSILLDPAQHFQLDLDQAPKAIAAFRQAAEGLRDLKREVGRLAHIAPPGRDAVSINAAKEIGQWAVTEEPGSLRSALESGAMQLEKTADALEQSLATYRNTDELNAAYLGRPQL